MNIHHRDHFHYRRHHVPVQKFAGASTVGSPSQSKIYVLFDMKYDRHIVWPHNPPYIFLYHRKDPILMTTKTRKRWRCVKTSAGNISECLKNHAQHQRWTSTWCFFHKSHLINARLRLSCNSVESKFKPHWVYIINEHDDFCHYGPYAIPSKITPWCSHPACFVNQNDILIELSCKQEYLPLVSRNENFWPIWPICDTG